MKARVTILVNVNIYKLVFTILKYVVFKFD